MRTTLRSVIGTSDTHTYSVIDARSDRERYMRAAPMDLRTPSQNYSTPRGVEAERRQRGRTEWRLQNKNVRKTLSEQISTDLIINSYFLLEGASDVTMKDILAPDRKESHGVINDTLSQISVRSQRELSAPVHARVCVKGQHTI